MEIVSALWLDEKIAELNDWIYNHHKLHSQYRQKVHDRDYWVQKRIDI